MLKNAWILGVVAVLLAGCGGRHPPGPGAARERQVELQIMLAFDANGDGVVTREEMEQGLARQFAAADTNHDGRLEKGEADAENQRRWAAQGPAASPVIDWNQDGVIDRDEFGSTARTLFTQLDVNHDGVLSKDELKPIRAFGDGRRGAARAPEGRRRPGGGRDGGEEGGAGGPQPYPALPYL